MEFNGLLLHQIWEEVKHTSGTLVSSDMSSVEGEKGVINIQWCSVENQKGTTTVQKSMA